MRRKKEIIKLAKTKKPTGNDVGVNTSLPIYIDDHLSKSTRERWYEAKELVDEGTFHSARCMDGKIRVKEQQDGPAITYTCLDSMRYKEWKARAGKSITSKKRNNDARSPPENRGEKVENECENGSTSQRSKQSRTDGTNSEEAALPMDGNNIVNKEMYGRTWNERKTSQTTLDCFRLRKE